MEHTKSPFELKVIEIKESRNKSVSVSQEFNDHFLGSVPPIKHNRNGFICGEAYSGDSHYTFLYRRDEKNNTRHEAELLPLRVAEALLDNKIINRNGQQMIVLDQYRKKKLAILMDERSNSKPTMYLIDNITDDLNIVDYGSKNYLRVADVRTIIDRIENKEVQTVRDSKNPQRPGIGIGIGTDPYPGQPETEQGHHTRSL